MQDVRAVLDPEEPDYADGARLGRAALPHLAALAAGDDVLLAAKAAHLAARIGGDAAADIVLRAAGHADPAVRVAAAGAAADLDAGMAARVLERLSQDADASVRRRVVRTASAHVGRSGDAAARRMLESLAQSDPDASVRKATRDALSQKR
jgi:HEAT repeat protein